MKKGNRFILVVLVIFILAVLLFSFKHFSSRNISIEDGKKYFIKTNFGSEKDCLSDRVCLTRGDAQCIYNSVLEPGYSQGSPKETLWAVGNCSEKDNLHFTGFVNSTSNNPPSIVNKNMCLYLIEEKKYYNIKFINWSGGAIKGGGFAYIRSENPILET